MDDAPKNRPWWRKKRLWAAALWLLLPPAYFASPGPAAYAVGRGWIDAPTHRAIFTPAEVALFYAGLGPQVWRSEAQWLHLGGQHAAPVLPPVADAPVASSARPVGRSEPRFDAETIETFRASLESIETALPDEELLNFCLDLRTMELPALWHADEAAAKAGRPASPLDAARFFHGMTAPDLRAAAERFRAAEDRAHAGAAARQNTER